MITLVSVLVVTFEIVLATTGEILLVIILMIANATILISLLLKNLVTKSADVLMLLLPIMLGIMLSIMLGIMLAIIFAIMLEIMLKMIL